MPGPPFKAANLTDDTGYSCLAGPGIKAANTRELVPFLVEMADLYNGSASLHDQALRKLLKALSLVLEIVLGATVFYRNVTRDRCQSSPSCSLFITCCWQT